MAKKFVTTYREKIGDWGEIVTANALRRANYQVKTQPRGNRIPLVDMVAVAKGGNITWEVQVKGTAAKGRFYKLDFSYVRDLLTYIEQQPVDYRMLLAIANTAGKHVYFFVDSQIAEIYQRKDERTPHDQLPGSISFGYLAATRALPLLRQEWEEGVAISRAFEMNGDGAYTLPLFDEE